MVATPTAEEAVRSVGVEMDAMELTLLDPDGVTNSVDVLMCQQTLWVTRKETCLAWPAALDSAAAELASLAAALELAGGTVVVMVDD